MKRVMVRFATSIARGAALLLLCTGTPVHAGSGAITEANQKLRVYVRQGGRELRDLGSSKLTETVRNVVRWAGRTGAKECVWIRGAVIEPSSAVKLPVCDPTTGRSALAPSGGKGPGYADHPVTLKIDAKTGELKEIRFGATKLPGLYSSVLHALEASRISDIRPVLRGLADLSAAEWTEARFLDLVLDTWQAKSGPECQPCYLVDGVKFNTDAIRRVRGLGLQGFAAGLPVLGYLAEHGLSYLDSKGEAGFLPTATMIHKVLPSRKPAHDVISMMSEAIAHGVIRRDATVLALCDRSTPQIMEGIATRNQSGVLVKTLKTPALTFESARKLLDRQLPDDDVAVAAIAEAACRDTAVCFDEVTKAFRVDGIISKGDLELIPGDTSSPSADLIPHTPDDLADAMQAKSLTEADLVRSMVGALSKKNPDEIEPSYAAKLVAEKVTVERLHNKSQRMIWLVKKKKELRTEGSELADKLSFWPLKTLISSGKPELELRDLVERIVREPLVSSNSLRTAISSPSSNDAIVAMVRRARDNVWSQTELQVALRDVERAESLVVLLEGLSKTDRKGTIKRVLTGKMSWVDVARIVANNPELTTDELAEVMAAFMPTPTLEPFRTTLVGAHVGLHAAIELASIPEPIKALSFDDQRKVVEVLLERELRAGSAQARKRETTRLVVRMNPDLVLWSVIEQHLGSAVALDKYEYILRLLAGVSRAKRLRAPGLWPVLTLEEIVQSLVDLQSRFPQGRSREMRMVVRDALARRLAEAVASGDELDIRGLRRALDDAPTGWPFDDLRSLDACMARLEPWAAGRATPNRGLQANLLGQGHRQLTISTAIEALVAAQGRQLALRIAGEPKVSGLELAQVVASHMPRYMWRRLRSAASRQSTQLDPAVLPESLSALPAELQQRILEALSRHGSNVEANARDPLSAAADQTKRAAAKVPRASPVEKTVAKKTVAKKAAPEEAAKLQPDNLLPDKLPPEHVLLKKVLAAGLLPASLLSQEVLLDKVLAEDLLAEKRLVAKLLPAPGEDPSVEELPDPPAARDRDDTPRPLEQDLPDSNLLASDAVGTTWVDVLTSSSTSFKPAVVPPVVKQMNLDAQRAWVKKKLSDESEAVQLLLVGRVIRRMNPELVIWSAIKAAQGSKLLPDGFETELLAGREPPRDSPLTVSLQDIFRALSDLRPRWETLHGEHVSLLLETVAPRIARALASGSEQQRGTYQRLLEGAPAGQPFDDLRDLVVCMAHLWACRGLQADDREAVDALQREGVRPVVVTAARKAMEAEHGGRNDAEWRAGIDALPRSLARQGLFADRDAAASKIERLRPWAQTPQAMLAVILEGVRVPGRQQLSPQDIQFLTSQGVTRLVENADVWAYWRTHASHLSPSIVAGLWPLDLIEPGPINWKALVPLVSRFSQASDMSEQGLFAQLNSVEWPTEAVIVQLLAERVVPDITRRQRKLLAGVSPAEFLELLDENQADASAASPTDRLAASVRRTIQALERQAARFVD